MYRCRWQPASWDRKDQVAQAPCPGGGGSAAGRAWGRAEGPWTNRVFFAGAPLGMLAAALSKSFARYGDIRSFVLYRMGDGRSRGMGVCVFETTKEAGEALRGGVVIEGHPIFMQEDVSQYKYHERRESRGALATYGRAPRPSRRRSSPYSGVTRGGPCDGEGDGEDSAEVPRGPATVREVPVSDPNKAVYFWGVHEEFHESSLWQLFESAGELSSLCLLEGEGGRSQGRGIAEFTTAAAAFRASIDLHGRPVVGRPIAVDLYNPPDA